MIGSFQAGHDKAFLSGGVRKVSGSVLGLLCCSCILTHHDHGFLDVAWMICCTEPLLSEGFAWTHSLVSGCSFPKQFQLKSVFKTKVVLISSKSDFSYSKYKLIPVIDSKL